MDKFHCKSSSILNEYMKEKQRRKEAKKREAKKKARRPPPQEQLHGVRVSYCSYCNKAFSGSGYLVKHILRRHPDELLEIHNQFVNSNGRHRDADTSTQPKVLYTGMEKDIIDIKETLKDFKSLILEKIALHDGDEGGTHSKSCKDSARNAHRVTKFQGEEFRRFRLELQELRLQCQNSEMTIYNLEEKHKTSLEAIKREIALNEENREQNSARIHVMVRNILRTQKKEINHIREEVAKQLTSLHQIVTADIQKQRLEWDNKLSSLKSQHIADIEKLQSLIQVNIARLEKAQNEKNIGKMFEQHLQNYLNKMAVKPKRKHDVNRTLYDTFQPNSTNLVSSKKNNEGPRWNHFKRKTPKLHAVQKKCEVDNTKKYQGRLSPNQQQGIDNSSNFQERITSSPKQYLPTVQKQKIQKLFITKRVKAAMQSNPYMLERLQEEFSDVLERKMQSFGFQPGQKRLSNAEFEAKKVLVYNDMSHSCGKGDFFTLRNRIDDLVTKKVKSYLSQNKSARRIHFASPEFTIESPAMSSILAEEDSVELKRPEPCVSSGFVVRESMFEELPKNDEPPKNSVENEDIPKKKELNPVIETPIALPPTDFDPIHFLQNDFNSKISLKSSSSDSSEVSSSPLRAIVVKENPGNIMTASGSGNKEREYNQSPSVRRKLKFEQADAESTAPQSLPLSKKVMPLNAKEVDELDSKSSLESLSDWDSSGDDDKLDVIHL